MNWQEKAEKHSCSTYRRTTQSGGRSMSKRGIGMRFIERFRSNVFMTPAGKLLPGRASRFGAAYATMGLDA